MITHCTRCGSLYEAGSEEQANELDRPCPNCRPRSQAAREAGPDDDGRLTLPSFLGEMRFQAGAVAELLHEVTRDVQAGVQTGFSPRMTAVLHRTKSCLVEIRDRLNGAIGSLERAGFTSNGPVGVTGGDPPLVITGPGGDFRTEHRACANCHALFTAVAGDPGTLCKPCLDYRKEVCT